MKSIYKVLLFSLFIIFFSLSILLVINGCKQKYTTPLRIGTCMWTGFEPLYLAVDKNYINKSVARLIEYPTTNGTILGFRNGTIDMAAISVDEAIVLKTYDIDFKIILVLDISHGGDSVLSKPGINSVKELKGKRVGVETTTLGSYFLTKALNSGGLTLSDISVVHIPVTEGEHAYKSDEIDAIVTFEPAKTRILNLGAKKIFDSSKVPNAILDVLVVKTDILKHRKKDLKDILTGWFKAVSDVNNNLENSIQIMAEREHISVTEFKTSLKGLVIPSLGQNISLFSGTPSSILSTAEQINNFLLENKIIKNSPNITDMFNGTILREIKK